VNGDAAPRSSRARVWGLLAFGAVVIAALAIRLIGAAGRPELPVVSTIPEFSLIDQLGRPYGSADLAGKVWIASFVYTTCPGPCPRVVQQMAEVQRRIGPEPEVAFVSISVDPEADTPPVLAAYTESRAIDAQKWRFLTGPLDQVLAVVRGGFLLALVRTDEADAETIASEGPIVHSVRLVLVDRARRVRGYYESTEPDSMDRLVEDARRLLRAGD
jgi:protein SCO1/2